jgi:hypothetical protein
MAGEIGGFLVFVLMVGLLAFGLAGALGGGK